jgi:hypothetical protein
MKVRPRTPAVPRESAGASVLYRPLSASTPFDSKVSQIWKVAYRPEWISEDLARTLF